MLGYDGVKGCYSYIGYCRVFWWVGFKLIRELRLGYKILVGFIGIKIESIKMSNYKVYLYNEIFGSC